MADPAPAAPLFTPKEVDALPTEARQPIADAHQLFAQAAETHELQLDFLDRGQGLAAELGATTVRKDQGEEPPGLDVPGPVVMIGPLKKLERSADKVAKDYRGDWSRLQDVVRASIAVDTYAEVPALLQRLLSSGVKLARKPKDRFYNPTSSGYRDVLLNVMYPNGHIGEIQVHIKSMLKAKEEGHPLYREVQNIENAVKAEGRAVTPEERATIDTANAQAQALYAKAWADAQGGGAMSTGKKATQKTAFVAGKQFFEYEDFPAIWEVDKLPVVFTLAGPRTVSVETFFREARPLTPEQFQALRGAGPKTAHEK